MSRHNEFDRTLARWFDAEAPSVATADVLDQALRATGARRPRPRLFAALDSHWVGDSAGATTGAATLRRTGVRASAALIIVLLVLGLLAAGVIVGTRLLQPAPVTGRLPLAYGVDGDVFLAEADGSNAVRIANGDPGVVACAVGEGQAKYLANGTTWSPDGRYLAYWDWRGPRCAVSGSPWGTVIVNDAEGNNVARFFGQGWAISWSPDSARLAILDKWLHGQVEDLTIGIYGSDGTRQMTLTVPSAFVPASGDYSAAWSRDGSSIMLPGVRVPLDGGDATLSEESGFFTGCCAYSPDGSLRGVVDAGTLVLEESDTPEDQKVGPLELNKLAWAPDGTLVAFERPTDVVEGNATELLVRDVATGSDVSIVRVAPSGRLDIIEFSGDGDRILFLRSDSEGGARSLWSIGVDGSDARLLVDGIEWADLQPQN